MDYDRVLESVPEEYDSEIDTVGLRIQTPGGTEIEASELQRLGGYHVGVTQPITVDPYIIPTSTAGEMFERPAHAEVFLENALEDIQTEEALFDGLALVGHNADEATAGYEAAPTDPIETIHVRGDDGVIPESVDIVDVFAVRTGALPDDVSIDDVTEYVEPIIDVVYGLSDGLPKELEDLSGTQAYGGSSIEVYTATIDDVHHRSEYDHELSQR